MNKTERKFSKRAIWLAVNSEYGERLVEIAREHAQLARELIVTNKHGHVESAQGTSYDIVRTRIEQLRAERDAIIEQYEEAALNGITDESLCRS